MNLPKEVRALYKEMIIKNKNLIKVTVLRDGREEKVKLSDLPKGPQRIVVASLLTAKNHI